jgi:hypothetical protein
VWPTSNKIKNSLSDRAQFKSRVARRKLAATLLLSIAPLGLGALLAVASASNSNLVAPKFQVFSDPGHRRPCRISENTVVALNY